MGDLSKFCLSALLADTLTIEDVAGKKLSILDIDFVKGQYGDIAIVTVTDEDGEVIKLRTGSVVLLDILKQAKEESAYPYPVKFIKVKRYWTIEV